MSSKIGRPTTGMVVLRHRSSKKNDPGLELGIPVGVATHLHHLVGSTFKCELTEEGILFRPVETFPESEREIPSWARA